MMKHAPNNKSKKFEPIDVEALNSKQNRSLYEARKKIHPKRAIGTFRTFKWLVMALTLGIYYITPWIRWERGPGLPDQAVLLDMANRRFYFFFIEIWPHEFFYVAGMLVMAGIGLFLVTSVFGRAWCGYTCPQTVWVDLFLVVERYFEGDRNARIKLDSAPWNTSKIYKRFSKHIVWILISISTGGAWIFYFADAPTLLRELSSGEAAFIAYATIATLTATTYIFGGFLREQVCTYMCPWPRIQAAMMDEHSLTVTYNDWRGEPRSRHSKRLKAEGKIVGDCVDCNACVAVCPMGIDIRDGQQLECITCALCIDACDGIMSKLGLEKGLISYATLDAYNSNMNLAGMRENANESQSIPSKIRDTSGRLTQQIIHTPWRSLLRFRSLLYLAIYFSIGLTMSIMLVSRSRLDVNLLHDRNPLFTVLSNGDIRNGYEIKILNMTGHARQFLIKLEDLPNAQIRIGSDEYNTSQWVVSDVDADKLKSIRLFITLPKEELKTAQTPFAIKVSEMGGTENITTHAIFEAPKDVMK